MQNVKEWKKWQKMCAAAGEFFYFLLKIKKKSDISEGVKNAKKKRDIICEQLRDPTDVLPILFKN